MSLHLILSALLVTSASPIPSPNPTAAALRICESPIPWRITALDERFGLDAQEAADAVRRGAILWGEAVGGKLLFREEPAGGAGTLEIRFIFDERQETITERNRREADLAAEAQRIEVSRIALDSLRAELDRYRAIQVAANRAYLDRTSEYNRLVAMLNDAGGVAPEMNARLGEMARALDDEWRQVEAVTDQLNRMVAATNQEGARLNAEIDAYNRASEAFQRDFEGVRFVPSIYQETRRELGPFTTSLTRSIEIYSFEERNDLILLLTREMGRALGLPLSELPGSVMSGTAPTDRVPALHPSDVAALQAHCAVR